MISLDDGKTEMAAVVDTTMGGSSMSDGSLEVMVHRRCQHDDSRGVQEPLNETMCGCNDIGAAPGKMVSYCLAQTQTRFCMRVVCEQSAV